MTEEALQIYKDCHEFHLKMTKAIVQLESKMVASGIITDQVDAALVAREAANAIEHCVRQLRRLEMLSTQVACALWASTPSSDPKRIKTEYCTAYPNVTFHPSVPSFTSSYDRYVAAMRGLGVPEPVIEVGALKLHWKRLGEYVTRCVEEGRDPPEGIDLNQTAPRYTLGARANEKLGRLMSGAPGSTEVSDEESSDVDRDDSHPF